MVSIIVPIYRAEKTLARCIESVVAQEYKDWELILVDDGSPDRSGEICDVYAAKDDRISVIHQENSGVAEARNAGIKVSKGEFICFIDSDDYVSSSYLSDFAYSLSIDFELQGMTLVYTDSTKNHDKLPSANGLLELQSLLMQDEATLDLLNGPCCKLFKSSVVKECGILFPTGLSYGEDSIFVLSYLRHCHKINLVQKSNYCYVHDDAPSLSASRQSGEKMMSAVSSDYRQYQLLLEHLSSLPESYTRYYCNYKSLMFFNAIHNQLISSTTNKAKIQFLQSISQDMFAFFRKAEHLPFTYHAISRMMYCMPIHCLVHLYPWVYRFFSFAKNNKS